MADLGQVFTNKHVASYMAALLDLNPNAKILDPCFGKGVFLGALKKLNYTDLAGYEIDSSLYQATKKRFPDIRLYNADFLNSPDVLYDGIIMNPPYVRQEKIDDLKYLGISKELLRQNKLFGRLPQNANLYMYFLVKAISLLKDKGQLVIIFPNIWLNSLGGKQLREIIDSACVISHQINITGNVFDKKALVDVVILKLVKNGASVTTEIKDIYFDGINFTERESINKMDLGLSVGFTAIASAQRGLSTGYNKFFINPGIDDIDGATIPILSSPKAISGFDASVAKFDRLLYVNYNNLDSCNSYLNDFKNRILTAEAPKTLYKKILAGENWYNLKLIPGRGIIFSYYIRNEVKFILNETDYQIRDNFYIIRPKIDALLLFALLNNYYTYYQVECLGKTYGAGLLKIQRYDLENIKFPDYRSFTENDISALKGLSGQLIRLNDKTYIDEITKIISRYVQVDAETITARYNALKKHRLGEIK